MKQTIVRKQLLEAAVNKRDVTSVDVREIRFEPGQQTGRHLHPCAVFGYVAEGTALLQIEGEDPKIFAAGSAFHEPAGRIIARFDNASDAEPMKFVAFYLLSGEEALIEMLTDQ